MAARRRVKSAKVLTGHEGVDRVLKNLSSMKVANNIGRISLRAGARVFAKHIKKKLPSGHKEMRRAIGSRVGIPKRSVKGTGTARRGITSAKAGVGVGKREAGLSRQRKNRWETARIPGIGIGVQNLHWYVAGTLPRWKKTTGQYTGYMPAKQPNPVQAGFYAGRGEARAKIRTKAREQLGRELKKAGKTSYKEL